MRGVIVRDRIWYQTIRDELKVNSSSYWAETIEMAKTLTYKEEWQINDEGVQVRTVNRGNMEWSGIMLEQWQKIVKNGASLCKMSRNTL